VGDEEKVWCVLEGSWRVEEGVGEASWEVVEGVRWIEEVW